MATKANQSATTVVKSEVTSSKYLQLLQKSGNQKELEQQVYNAEDALAQLEGDIKETGRSLTKAQRTTEELKSVFPLDTQSIANSALQVEQLTNGLKFLENLKEELFG